MFHVEVVGDATAVNAAVNAMVSSDPNSVEAPLLASLKTLVTTAVTNAVSAPGFTGNFQVLVRGGFQNGATAFSAKVNNVQVDMMGNVRFGGSPSRASAYTP